MELYLLIVALGVCSLVQAAPIAMHQLVVVEENGDSVIRVQGHDSVKASTKVCVHVSSNSA